MSRFTDEREEQLDAIAARIDERAQAQSEYLTDNVDAAEPLYYDEWEIDLRNVDEEYLPLIEEFKAREGKRWQQELKGLCDAECIGIYITNNEVCSYTIGECEEQLDDEVHAELMALTDEEHEYVRHSVRECYLPERKPNRGSTEIYLNHDYTRWVLVLDGERLAEHVAAYAEEV